MFKFSQVKSISEICKTEWKNLVEDKNPFLNYNFFMAMERSGCTSLQSGWEPNHFLITDKNTKNDYLLKGSIFAYLILP